MRIFWCSDHAAHDPGRLAQPAGGSENYYSEVAERCTVLLHALAAAEVGEVVDVAREPDRALPAAVAAVHDPDLVAFLEQAYGLIAAEEGWVGPDGAMDRDRVVIAETFAVPGGASAARSTSAWAELGRRCTDTSAPIFLGTWGAVAGSARTAVAAAEHVLGGSSSAYALSRPPGHHAGRGWFGGFCYLNNAAVAAQHLVDAGRRVAIVDVDFHHGNGTQDIFWDRADVFYTSLHVDPNVDYPYFAGFADEVGGPGAPGANLNVPLAAGCDEARYLDALDGALGAVDAFAADVLVVSLGVDTHRDDPIGRFDLGTSAFVRIGERLAEVGLPTVIVQEGGYHLPTIGGAVVGVLAAWR